jgi:murein DD-endopeptidase MepM/ murein hydrolase activator NlpD
VRGRKRIGTAAVLLLILTAGCALPRWPVDGRMTSPWGVRMRGGWFDFHHGVDVYVPSGTPVRAMKSGRVAHAGNMGSYGLVVMIDHGTNLRTVYAHLSRIDVRAGEHVAHQHVIGLSGATGNATGPHLHFEIIRWGRSDDPVPLLGGPPRGR